MPKCPRGCTRRGYSYSKGKYVEMRIDLVWLKFKVLSKSGKTLYDFWACPKCKRVFKRGRRVESIAEAKRHKSIKGEC